MFALHYRATRAVIPLDDLPHVYNYYSPGGQGEESVEHMQKALTELAEVVEDNARLSRLNPTDFARVTASRAPGSGL